MLGQQLSTENIFRWYQKNIRPWNQYIVTVIVLMLSAFLAYMGSTTVFAGIVGLFVAVVGAAYLFMNLQYGLMILILVTYFLSFSIATGTNTGINATILMILGLTVLWFADMFFVKKKIRLADSPTFKPLLLMVVVSILAFINGFLPWFATVTQLSITAQIGGLMLFILSAAAFIVSVHLIPNVTWLKRLVWVFIAIGGIFVLTRFTPQLMRLGNRTFAYGSTTASLFWLWIVVLSASQAFFNKKLPRLARLALLGVLALTLYHSVIVAYDWKSGWLPALAALAVIIWLGAPKLRPLILPAAALVILLNFVNIPGLVTGDENYSVLTRVEAWRILLEIIKVNPFLGLGPSNYYWYTPLFPILGYSVSFNSHNNFIDIVAQIGIFGLFFFLWFFWELTKTGFRLLKTAPEGFEHAYVIGAIAGIAGTLVSAFLGDWVIPFVYNVGFVGFRSSVFGWIFLGGLVALELFQKQSTAVETT
jgi:O-antigen ligase